MKQNVNNVDLKDRITVNANTLAGMLDCGRATAVKIGTEAGARIQIGNRVLFKLADVQRYINEKAGRSDSV